jgi:hypothetical protein
MYEEPSVLADVDIESYSPHIDFCGHGDDVLDFDV